MKDPLTFTDEEILEEARKLRVEYGLKRTIRYNSERQVNTHSESVAEHVFALIYLAHYFLQLEEKGKTLNAQKVYDIFLFHDFGEIKHGDIVSYFKTDQHRAQETEAAKEIFAALPESLQKMGYDNWLEYEEHTTPEGKFCYALDKIEPLFELLDPVNEKSVRRLKTTYDLHVEHKFKATTEYPLMRRFNEVLSNDMKARGVFWEE